ncbi:MAG: S-layer homology domain-containing protein [Fervidobacterium sp.]
MAKLLKFLPKKHLKSVKMIMFFLSFCILTPSVTLIGATIKDLSPSASGYKAVNFLVEKGIMDVDASANFKPALLITKLDLARYLYNVINQYDLESLTKSKTQLSSQNVIPDLSKLDSRITVMENKLNTIQNEVSELKKRIDSLEKKISGITLTGSSSSKTDQAISTVQKEILDLKSNVATLDKNLSNTQKELKDKVSTIESKLKTIEEYYSAVVSESAKSTAQRMELDNLKTKVENLDQSFNSLLKDYTNKVYSLSNDVSKISGRVAGLETISESNSKEIENLNSRVKILERTLDASITFLTEKSYTTASDLLTMNKKIEELDNRLSRLENIVGKTDEFVKKLEAIDVITVANTFSNLQLLTNRFDQLQARVTYLEKSHNESVNTILNTLVQMRDENIENLEKLGSEINNVKENELKTDERINMMKEDIEKVKSELNTLKIISTLSVLTSVILFIIITAQ